MITRAVPEQGKKQNQKQPVWKRVFAPVLVILLGLGIILYPVVSTQFNNIMQNRNALDYAQAIERAEAEDKGRLIEEIEAAKHYNLNQLGGPILDPWLGRISDDNLAYQDYLGQLNSESAMAQLVIPAIDVNLPIYHGTSDEVLQKGLGHLYGSSLPVGGDTTNTVISGHTGLSNATLFDNLGDVAVGDAVYLSTFGEKMKYEVDQIDVVLPHETDGLEPRAGEDRMTLITCTPYGQNTHRLLVHGHRVTMDASGNDLFNKRGSIMQWWMWLLLALSIIVIIFIIWWIMQERKKETAKVHPGRHRL
ncbi:class C sortase [Corynebacterium pseudodiphtheriticum]|uniref:class C sortase n=1 Tax=Corynebacterium pseudodiphtheriticum TaxID=37637 RepID=UPI00254DA338|nr:class C sortase [Corynebacterium pseudodiphtheriticum]MDK8613433.1 class C sortase [Corynebacterium pseudodiphtheriticum]MDK8737366.1 class C sortase [Corynebacterium pseudodiphtheriticum]MDK8744141.1 class C sortase [Corynebacterium pseudodiphtheriticum]